MPFTAEYLLIPVALLAAAAYTRGTAGLWRSAGVGKGVTVWQVLSFCLGLIALLATIASPVDTLAHALFSGHMAQHMLIVVVAAPLLAYGAPLFPILWSLPSGRRREVGAWWNRADVPRALWSFLMRPVVVWLLFALTIWVWHLPALYQLALVDPLVHALEHWTLLFSSYLFWWLVLQPLGRRRLDRGAAVIFVFLTSLHVTMLGAAISVAPEQLYPIYDPAAFTGGLDGVSDQRLAALIMRTPMAFAFLLAVAVLFVNWLVQLEKRAQGRPLKSFD